MTIGGAPPLNNKPWLQQPPGLPFFCPWGPGAPPCEIEEIQFRQRLRGSDVGRHVPHAAKSYPMSPLVSDVARWGQKVGVYGTFIPF